METPDQLREELAKVKATLAWRVKEWDKREAAWAKAQDEVRSARCWLYQKVKERTTDLVTLLTRYHFEIRQLRKERDAWRSLAEKLKKETQHELVS